MSHFKPGPTKKRPRIRIIRVYFLGHAGAVQGLLLLRGEGGQALHQPHDAATREVVKISELPTSLHESVKPQLN